MTYNFEMYIRLGVKYGLLIGLTIYFSAWILGLTLSFVKSMFK